jgi:hypothetical protein
MTLGPRPAKMQPWTAGHVQEALSRVEPCRLPPFCHASYMSSGDSLWFNFDDPPVDRTIFPRAVLATVVTVGCLASGTNPAWWSWNGPGTLEAF